MANGGCSGCSNVVLVCISRCSRICRRTYRFVYQTFESDINALRIFEYDARFYQRKYGRRFRKDCPEKSDMVCRGSNFCRSGFGFLI